MIKDVSRRQAAHDRGEILSVRATPELDGRVPRALSPRTGWAFEEAAFDRIVCCRLRPRKTQAPALALSETLGKVC